MTTGKILKKGYIYVPDQLLETAGFNENTEIEIIVEERNNRIVIQKKTVSPIEQLFGLGSEIWENVDIDSYVRGERETWQDQK